MRTVSYETIRGVGDNPDMYLLTIGALGRRRVNALDEYKELIHGLGNHRPIGAGYGVVRPMPYTMKRIEAATSDAFFPSEVRFFDDIGWPFEQICSVGTESVTLVFEEDALRYTEEEEIRVVAANIASLLGAQYFGEQMPVAAS